MNRWLSFDSLPDNTVAVLLSVQLSRPHSNTTAGSSAATAEIRVGVYFLSLRLDERSTVSLLANRRNVSPWSCAAELRCVKWYPVSLLGASWAKLCATGNPAGSTAGGPYGPPTLRPLRSQLKAWLACWEHHRDRCYCAKVELVPDCKTFIRF